MAILPSLLLAFISSGKVRRSVKKVDIFVEIIPCEVTDVVSKPIKEMSHVGRLANDAIGYESLHDAIANAQVVGSRLLQEIKPENLFFFFGQTVQSLQCALREFLDQHCVSYPAEDFYGPIYTEQDAGNNQQKGEPLAIVLCKLIHAEQLQPFIGTEQQKGCDDAKRYEITWSEFQKLKTCLEVTVLHGRIVYVDHQGESSV